MDKYQSYILNELRRQIVSVYAYADSEAVQINGELHHNLLKQIKIEDEITIKQNDDITKTKYNLIIINKGIYAIYAIRKDDCIPFQNTSIDYTFYPGKTIKNQNVFYYELDFDNKIDSIKIVFNNHIADDLIIPITFIDADKEKYYAKKEGERIAELLRNAPISCATGEKLVNIYFQPCSEQYAKTEISLYHNNFMIAKYNIEGELYFKAVPDLAYGTYSFVLKQFSCDGNTLLETGHIEFSINPPATNSGTRKNTVVGMPY